MLSLLLFFLSPLPLDEMELVRAYDEEVLYHPGSLTADPQLTQLSQRGVNLSFAPSRIFSGRVGYRTVDHEWTRDGFGGNRDADFDSGDDETIVLGFVLDPADAIAARLVEPARGFVAALRDDARRGEPAVLVGDQPELRIALGDGAGRIATAVVDHDDLVVRIGEVPQRLEALLHRALGVVGADHDGDPGRVRRRGCGGPRVDVADGIEGHSPSQAALRPRAGMLGPDLCDEVEGPDIDVPSAGIQEQVGAAAAEGRAAAGGAAPSRRPGPCGENGVSSHVAELRAGAARV